LDAIPERARQLLFIEIYGYSAERGYVADF
jgi:hypothetical protein